MTDTPLSTAPANQRCGLVAIVGAPNAGKSTLTNALVGQKVAIVSPKAQTTRVRLMGIAIEGHPNLARILTADDWDGHPLRKDYPIGGEPVRFSEEE